MRDERDHSSPVDERPAVRIETLGCKVNQADSDALGAELVRAGCRIAADDERANVCVINTCSVTHVADAKARKLIRRLAKDNPNAAIIVTGCYAERAAEELARISGVAHVVPNTAKPDLPRFVREILSNANSAGAARPAGVHPHPSFSLEGRGVTCAQIDAGPRPARPGSVRAFVAVQDGCDHRCAYCIVPDVRGPMRSRPIADVTAQVRDLAAAGAREVVICGIRLGAYGEQRDGIGLAGLLRALADAPVARLRLSSIEPWDISDGLIAEIRAHPRLCAHLHLPLQSGDDGILRAMGRPHSYADYQSLVGRLRAAVPGIGITTDLMVGFPGESDEAFMNTVRAVQDIGFARAHVFRYSPRPGTRAAVMSGQVPETVKGERAVRLAGAADEAAQRFAAGLVGQTVAVLFEEHAGGICSGLTGSYVTARVPGDQSLVGRVAGVEVHGVECTAITGRLARVTAGSCGAAPQPCAVRRGNGHAAET